MSDLIAKIEAAQRDAGERAVIAHLATTMAALRADELRTMQHTPGPWELSHGTEPGQGREPWFWVSASRTLHLRVYACPDGFVIGENEANARLIAAAPDLLAALKGVLCVADRKTDEFDAARAAIAKAVGDA